MCPAAVHSVTLSVSYVLATNSRCIYLCLNIFDPVYDQVQMGSALVSCWRGKDGFSEPSVTACEPRSLNDLPDEILLKIFSYFKPEKLWFIITKVCQRWNVLAKDVVLWRTLSYICRGNYNPRSCVIHLSPDSSNIAEVSCTALLVFRLTSLRIFPIYCFKSTKS